MKRLFKNNDVYACTFGLETLGKAIDFVRNEWNNPDVEIRINGNKITVVFQNENTDGRLVTLAEYEWR